VEVFQSKELFLVIPRSKLSIALCSHLVDSYYIDILTTYSNSTQACL